MAEYEFYTAIRKSLTNLENQEALLSVRNIIQYYNLLMYIQLNKDKYIIMSLNMS